MTIEDTEASALEGLAEFLLTHGRTEDAVRVLHGLTRVAPERHYAWYGLAVVHEEAGDRAGALEHWEAATQRCERPGLRLRYAEFLLRVDRIDQGILELRRLGAGDGPTGRRARSLLRVHGPG